MSHHVWSRVAVLAGVLVATPLLLAGTARAAPSPSATAVAENRQLVFTGGNLLGLTCTAVPNPPSITVPAASALEIVNETGTRARLVVDGVAWGEIAKNSRVEIPVERGPLSLRLTPTCLIPKEGSATVYVMAASPAPVPTTAAPSPLPSSAARPTEPASDVSQVSPPAPAPATTASGRRELLPGVPVWEVAEARPEPPGTPRAVVEVEPWATPSTGPASARPPSSAVAIKPGDVVAEPKPLSPGRKGPPLLLALIATICVIGVSASVIQAILAQRASRTDRA